MPPDQSPAADRAPIDTELLARDRRTRALLDAALTLLIHRAGGSLAFTEAEYLEVLALYGGSTRMNLHFEVVGEAGKPDTVHLRLENKPPANADLPA